MASKRNVKYVEQEEPTFLKKFKARVGYREPADINAKFSEEIDNSEIQSNENEREIEDEEPVVVVLKQGDMTAEQVAEFKKNSTSDCWDSKNDKPIFKKPEKRASSEKDVKKDAKKKKSAVKAVKNSTLLSFDEDDDEG